MAPPSGAAVKASSTARLPLNRFYKIVIALAVLGSVLFLLVHSQNVTGLRVVYEPKEADTKPAPPKHKTSKLHYVIAASNAKAPMCAALVSAVVNRYSPPIVLGWNATGELDVHKSHLAKLRNLQNYLHGPAGDHPDDLAIVLDGFDVMAQIPAETMLERYFDMIAKADQRVADRFSISLDEAHKRGLYHKLIYGVDKMCFPPLWNEAQCWAVPPNPLRQNLDPPRVGSETNPAGEMTDVYLNSGTVIGPIGDLRNHIDTALQLINDTWSADQRFKNSDQWYLGRIYGRQEVARTKALTGGAVPGLKDDRFLPDENEYESNRTEYHIAVDHEYAFTQTQCANNDWMRKLRYANDDLTVTVTEKTVDKKFKFPPFPIQLPASLYLAVERMWPAVNGNVPQRDAKTWIQQLVFNTNVYTKHVFGFYHNTCSKKLFVDKYRDLWFFPYAELLLRAAVKHNREKDHINAHPIDGRWWVPAHPYAKDLSDDLGGAFTDNKNESFIPFTSLCGEWNDQLFIEEPGKEKASAKDKAPAKGKESGKGKEPAKAQ